MRNLCIYLNPQQRPVEPGKAVKIVQKKKTKMAMNEKGYRLRWTKHDSNVLASFQALLKSKSFSDVTIFCQGQRFLSHRLVLSTGSEYLEGILKVASANMPANAPLFLILEGVSAEDLELLLEFMHKGEVCIDSSRLRSIFKAADTLKIKGINAKADQMGQSSDKEEDFDAIKRSRRLQCSFCDKSYGYETNLKAHVRQFHQGVRARCKLCHKSFTRNTTLRKHVAREHDPMEASSEESSKEGLLITRKE